MPLTRGPDSNIRGRSDQLLADVSVGGCNQSRRGGERSKGAGSLSWTVSKTGLRESPFITREEMPSS
jgi:hypothetical protein